MVHCWCSFSCFTDFPVHYPYWPELGTSSPPRSFQNKTYVHTVHPPNKLCPWRWGSMYLWNISKHCPHSYSVTTQQLNQLQQIYCYGAFCIMDSTLRVKCVTECAMTENSIKKILLHLFCTTLSAPTLFRPSNSHAKYFTSHMYLVFTYYFKGMRN